MKTKLWKKMLSVLVAGTTLFCLTACGSGTESDSAASDQTEENTDAQGTTEVAADAGQEQSAGRRKCSCRVFLSYRQYRACS